MQFYKMPFTKLAVFLIIFIFIVPRVYSSSFYNQEEIAKFQDEIVQKINNLETIDYNGKTRLKVTLSDLLSAYLALYSSTTMAVIKSEIAQTEQDKSFGKFVPKAILSGTYARDPLTPQVSDYLRNERSSLQAKFQHLTPLGISYYLEYTLGTINSSAVSRSGNSYSVNPNSQKYNRSSIAAGINIPLLNGLGVNSQLNYAKAKISGEQAVITLKGDVEQIAKNLIIDYTYLLSLIKHIDALRIKLNLSENLLKQAEIKFELGSVTNANVLELRSLVLNDKANLQVMTSILNAVDDSIRAALRKDDPEFLLYPIEVSNLADINSSEDEIIKDFGANSANYQKLLLERKKNEYDESSAFNSILPKLNLNMSYSINGYGDQANNYSTNIANHKDINGFAVGLNFEIPVGDGGGFSNYRQQKLKLALVDLQISSGLSDISIQVRDLLRKLDIAKAKIELQEKNVDLRGTILEQILEKYKLGSAAVTEVDDAQVKYLLSQKNLEDAKSDYIKNYYNIEISRGKLTELFPDIERLINF